MDFFIVGAAKCGTTTIWRWLSGHPDIFLPDTKEPHYFCYNNGETILVKNEMDPHYLSRITTRWDEYEKLYADRRPGQIAGDASPGYLYFTHTAERIRSFNPAAKIICIIRNPVERAFSQYMHHVRDGLEDARTFAEGLRREEQRRKEGWWWCYHYGAASLYADQWQAYCAAFPEPQRLLLLHDDLVSRPAETYERICQFLNVTPRPDVDFSKRVNETASLQTVPKFAGLHRLLVQGSKLGAVVKAVVPSRAARWARDQLLRLNNKARPELSGESIGALTESVARDLDKLSRLVDRDLSIWRAAI